MAATIAKGIVDAKELSGSTGLALVFAALIGAITWNLITWYFTLPSSSSHAGVAGQMATAWIFTIPAAGVMGGIAYEVSQLLGSGSSVGALVIAGLAAGGAWTIFRLAQRRNNVTPADLDRATGPADGAGVRAAAVTA